MAHGRFWRDDELAALRRVYADPLIRDPAAAHVLAYPDRKIDAVRLYAGKLHIADAHRKRPRAVTVQYDDGPPTMHARHPRGYVRPIMCPHCAGVFTMPADPLAVNSLSNPPSAQE
ncbi:MAG: hypothetical protein JWO85_566 [Candidatus Eremiobacteraeota bacterium]|nr:hypothetical protein [Candidatus Eremiobacteraeota bacterium]